MNEVELDFKKYLSSHKLKYTPERRKVLDEVLNLHGSFDADGLIDKLRSDRKRVSRATVYRTLDLLVKLGVLRRVAIGERAAFFENNLQWKSSGQLVCIGCGKVSEFEVPAQIDGTLRGLSKRHDFRPQNRNIEIFGYCPACHDKSLRALS